MTTKADDVLEIPLDLIDPPDVELRLTYDVDRLHELAQDIQDRGLLQPIGVVPSPTPGRWTRVWGGRRLAAHELIGRRTIRALVLPADSQVLTAAVAENLFRHDLSPVEEAHAIRAAVTGGISPAQLSLRLHRSTHWIEERLAINHWPFDVQHHLHTRELTLAVAAALAPIDNDQYRVYLIQSAIASGCSGVMARAWLADYHANRPRIIANQTTVEDMKARLQHFTVMIDCDACGRPTDLTTTRSFRICPPCQTDLDAATRQAPP